MKYIIPGSLFAMLIAISLSANASILKDSLKLYRANNVNIQYVGRIDFSNPLKPRMWSPGGYIKARFKGKKCQLLINDEVINGKDHNYLEIAVDNNKPYRIQTTGKINVITVAEDLADGEHTITICKDTESQIGYIDFVGLRCLKLLPAPAQPTRKIEYIGDSMTSGAGMDQSTTPCGKGEWYDQHNAYMSYGPRTSRNLNAQWQLTSVSGIGMVHSCCNMDVAMPQVFDKVYLRNDSLAWDFKRYQPDVVTVCLGQNDGLQDSILYCDIYSKFIKTLRQKYPAADIVCLSSPMADEKLSTALQHYLTAITANANLNGDKKVYKYFFSKRYYQGCGMHPDIKEHEFIADELTAYLKQLKGW
ncbi:MAG TPA: SGNH/GDSL hydrolase family protein [Mucilaginibacter sp.]|nr:SGNH/GDSL hydrolase family protein [Mucilaginibacter sp.]